jgi:hypothetical protein
MFGGNRLEGSRAAATEAVSGSGSSSDSSSSSSSSSSSTFKQAPNRGVFPVMILQGDRISKWTSLYQQMACTVLYTYSYMHSYVRSVIFLNYKPTGPG